ncbi:zinc-dependent metalloprotease [Pinibacter aurantiacus]|uniref:Zinc-dependent metalloprotease n=1 Tax=Pinibacter aurantiacus TaxID=2851599 RepID=A0A9E2SD88_9BACT|nr:zinc-dependent metalloprotease [Pinibacter aurantiacus]MBV4359227.1 zinc-dependent metalloprotease [Pinibacter aurantiacus]
MPVFYKRIIAPIIIIVLSTLQFHFLQAQDICGFDKYQNDLMKDPQYKAFVMEKNAQMQTYIATHPNLKISQRSAGPLYVIPVVVHIVHTGEAIGSLYNPGDDQIKAAIDYLNSVYNGSLPGIEGVGDVQIQFELAKRSPDCNTTNGIDRVNASSIPDYATYGVVRNTSSGVPANQIKDYCRWNTDNYYNIYVVNKIDGKDGTSGQYTGAFAALPSITPAYDGTIILANVMRSGNKALSHEIGHSLDLYHPFEGSSQYNQCPANNDCTKDGDFICDTDPITFNQNNGVIDFTCRTNTNSCTGKPYSINTEHNFMNYTNCATLFTADQKTRMLAAMATYPTRANLVAKTNMALVPTNATPACTPKINFEIKETLIPEATSATLDCRGYKDYTFNMSIGSAPVGADAVVHLNVSGTAYAKADFDLTTNGDFSNPSTALTFPVGSIAARSFTVRVYDDKANEPTESVIISFSVSGSGAVKGELAPTLTINIADNDSPPIMPGTPASSSIENGLTSFGLRTFNQTTYSKVKSQLLYTASELTAAGIPANVSINSISLNIQQKNTTAPFTDFTIKLTNTSTTFLSDATKHPFTALTTVKTYNSYSTSAGWNEFTFDIPFVWDGVSNLGIEICWDNGTTGSGSDYVLGYLDDGGAAYSNVIFSNGPTMNCATPSSFTGATSPGYKPNLKITYGLPGNTVATAISTSQTEYLGPYADVYFVSAAGTVLARVKNLTDHDYGCTSVSIDRQGTNASKFWDTDPSHYLADKTFKIIPSNNTPNGSYLVSLYYKNGEINGWRTTTSQNLDNAQIVKVSNGYYVPDVAPASPHSSSVSYVNATNSQYASDFIVSGNFSNTGFSGFGLGIPGVTPLPIDFLSFKGAANNNKAILDWQVATNKGISLFEVERSDNGMNYSKLGTVSVSQLPEMSNHYVFTDNDPLEGNNYYRIKEIELNGHISYSKVVTLNFAEQDNFTIYPNPVQSMLIVECNKETSKAVMATIFSIDGKLIKQIKASNFGKKMNVDVVNLAAGQYILRLVPGDGKVVNMKFIKQ